MEKRTIIKEEYLDLSAKNKIAKNFPTPNGGFKHNGELFTGLRITTYNEGYFDVTPFCNSNAHGVQIYYMDNAIGYTIYAYGKQILDYSMYMQEDKKKFCYIISMSEFLPIEKTEYLYNEDGGIELSSFESFNFRPEDLEYEKLLKDSPKMLNALLEYDTGDYIEIDYDTFVYASGYLRRESETREETEIRAAKVLYAYLKKREMEKGYYDEGYYLLPYFMQQDELSKQVIRSNQLPKQIKYIAGVDVAYNDLSQKMVGAIVVLDAETLEPVDSASHEMEISFPYIPGLFSFREVPPILEAYMKLRITPDLIICDAQGIAHPRGMGMASHLGLELNTPCIGCAKKRLIGNYAKELLGKERGSTQDLMLGDKLIGKALRTQTGINPLFVSIGHKIDLDTAIEWVLKASPQYRLPETTRQADAIVNQLLKERTDLDYFGDDKE